jgi:hypothetical protein
LVFLRGYSMPLGWRWRYLWGIALRFAPFYHWG